MQIQVSHVLLSLPVISGRIALPHSIAGAAHSATLQVTMLHNSASSSHNCSLHLKVHCSKMVKFYDHIRSHNIPKLAYNCIVQELINHSASYQDMSIAPPHYRNEIVIAPRANHCSNQQQLLYNKLAVG